jgi:hypothetical protein
MSFGYTALNILLAEVSTVDIVSLATADLAA